MFGQLRRATLRRGVVGGSWPWLLLGAVLWGLWALRLVARRPDAAVWKGIVGDDEVIEIATRRRDQRGG